MKKRIRTGGKGDVKPPKTKVKVSKPGVLVDAGARSGGEDPSPRKGILVLLVEDDQDHRDSLTFLLEDEGYDVTSAGQGLEAIERLRWGMRPGVILLDMRMHVMNGWEFRREVDRDPQCRTIPIIIMSGEILKREDLEGCAGWVPKPVRSRDLLKKLEECTRTPAVEARTR